MCPRPEVGHHQHHAPMLSSPIPPSSSVPTDLRRSCQTVQSDPAELVRLYDTLEAPKSSSANFHPSHDNFILAGMTSRNAFKHHCCANKIFTLVCHNPRFSVLSNFSTSNLVPVGAMIVCTTDPVKIYLSFPRDASSIRTDPLCTTSTTNQELVFT